MQEADKSYVASFQTEPYYEGSRCHWMICRTGNTEELVSWGYEPTCELAEAAAEKEVELLSCGMVQGGRVVSAMKSTRRRIPDES